MLTTEEVTKIDRIGLSSAYGKWPEASRKALKQPISCPSSRDFSLIVLAGMGGSGSACDVIADWLRPTLKIPVIVVKDHEFPGSANERTLAILSSLSGETEEVLRLLVQSKALGCSVATVSSGGRLMEMSMKLGVPHSLIEKILVPRASFPGLLYVPIRILKETGVIHDVDDEVWESVSAMTNAIADSSPSLDLETNFAKKTASRLFGKIPVVYSSSRWASAAYRFQKSMNENAKVPVQVGLYPELFHNEVETWAGETDRVLVILRNEMAEERELKDKIEFVESMAKKHGRGFVEVHGQGRLLPTLVKWICYLDMTSIYVAVLAKKDPLVTARIDELKAL